MTRHSRFALFATLCLSAALWRPLVLMAEDPSLASPRNDASVKPGPQGALLDGKTLSGWHVAETQDFEHHGEVRVVDGVIVLEMGQPATGIVWKGRPPRENYELSLEAKRLDGNDFFCGLTFPVGDSYVSFIVGGWGGGATGLSNLDGYSAVENETTGYTEFKADQWYRIRVRVTPQHVAAWIDDREQFQVERKDRKFSVWWEQEPMRPLGVATWRTKATVRNISLKSLKVSAATKEQVSKEPGGATPE